MRMFWIAVTGLAGSAALAMAQPAEPPNVLRIVREDVKPGKGAVHEKSEMGYVSALSQTKYPNYASAQESDNLPEKARFLRGGFVASLRG